ncbi:SpoIVB peptidase [Oscillibacter valericigenes]|uniref:SpoIVB peptidase n=1 Tax=Oscillibacter valericigenes TaxID=351091 RepID=UPI00195D0259|nr:SpoIVB peptidase [Oscillibacter valericigenes]MBM6909689.1 SpoIVB peptidase [Oscillibacter valericigenes]
MYGPFQKARHALRGGAALVLALLLCAAVPAKAAGVTADGTDRTASARMLVPVGHTVGIKLFARGVMVVKAPESGTPADDCGLRTGDIIVKCGGVSVTSSEQFQSLLQENGETATDLQVRREGESMTLSVSPEQNDTGTYCIGAWIRDSMAGIGTMTYYDPETGSFGALGHGITDSDTGILMPFASGSLLPSAVKAVKKGASGEAGELRGDFDLTGDLGDLSANTSSGIFGTLDPGEFTERLGDAIPVASAGEVHTGPAAILANVEGDAVREYDIEILQIVEDTADSRDLVIAVTDPELLSITGGIVQGMSGSPILQDGKFAGAVTHVLLNDPSKGYGILMETMLEAGDPAASSVT